MKKEHAAVAILSILLVAVSASWILSAQQSKHWVVVGSWVAYEPALEQNYTLVTNQFPISGEQWRITYSCSDYNFPGAYWDIEIFNVTSGNEIDYISRHELSGERNFGFTGTFYLNITIHGTLKDWGISAEELR